ncbi:MAG: hypothetical protein JWP12_243 [Bacteroidetes bacterium]|nr:hypothetical protein [Bacteroidota bacterium]
MPVRLLLHSRGFSVLLIIFSKCKYPLFIYDKKEAKSYSERLKIIVLLL